MNFVSHDRTDQNLNLVDPRLSYTYGAGSASGRQPVLQLRHGRDVPRRAASQATVACRSCSGPIRSTATSSRPHRPAQVPLPDVQIRLQRPFSNGFSFLRVVRLRRREVAEVLRHPGPVRRHLTWIDFSVTASGRTGAPTVTADPQHRFVGAATVEFPIGRGRVRLATCPRLDAFVGGWQLSGTYTYRSGAARLRRHGRARVA